MKSSFIHYTSKNEKKVVEGHDKEGDETSFWHSSASAPAGAIKSSANDLVLFLSKYLSPDDATLGKAMALTMQPTFKTDKQSSVGLGWQMLSLRKATVYWHNGGTGGFRSYVGFLPEKNRAVVLLCNYARAEGLDSAGLKLLIDASARP